MAIWNNRAECPHKEVEISKRRMPNPGVVEVEKG